MYTTIETGVLLYIFPLSTQCNTTNPCVISWSAVNQTQPDEIILEHITDYKKIDLIVIITTNYTVTYLETNNKNVIAKSKQPDSFQRAHQIYSMCSIAQGASASQTAVIVIDRPTRQSG